MGERKGGRRAPWSALDGEIVPCHCDREMEGEREAAWGKEGDDRGARAGSSPSLRSYSARVTGADGSRIRRLGWSTVWPIGFLVRVPLSRSPVSRQWHCGKAMVCHLYQHAVCSCNFVAVSTFTGQIWIYYYLVDKRSICWARETVRTHAVLSVSRRTRNFMYIIW